MHAFPVHTTYPQKKPLTRRRSSGGRPSDLRCWPSIQRSLADGVGMGVCLSGVWYRISPWENTCTMKKSFNGRRRAPWLTSSKGEFSHKVCVHDCDMWNFKTLLRVRGSPFRGARSENRSRLVCISKIFQDQSVSFFLHISAIQRNNLSWLLKWDSDGVSESHFPKTSFEMVLSSPNS